MSITSASALTVLMPSVKRPGREKRTMKQKGKPIADEKASDTLLEEYLQDVQEVASQIATNRRVAEMGSELVRRGGPQVHLRPGAHGYIKVEDALSWFRRGYFAAMSHFVDGLQGDFNGLESALQDQELDISTSAGEFWDALCPDQALIDAVGGEC
jgi:hypothetical protein